MPSTSQAIKTWTSHKTGLVDSCDPRIWLCTASKSIGAVAVSTHWITWVFTSRRHRGLKLSKSCRNTRRLNNALSKTASTECASSSRILLSKDLPRMLSPDFRRRTIFKTQINKELSKVMDKTTSSTWLYKQKAGAYNTKVLSRLKMCTDNHLIIKTTICLPQQVNERVRSDHLNHRCLPIFC